MRHHLAVALEGIENRREPITDRNEQFMVLAAAIRSELLDMEKATSTKQTQRFLSAVVTVLSMVDEMAQLRSPDAASAEMRKIINEYRGFIRALSA